MVPMAASLNSGLDWRDTGPLVPIAVLPCQLPPRRRDHPERELFRAILRSAAEDLSSPDPTIRCAAASWFKSPDLGWPVSLNMVCEILIIPEPRRLARTALRWAGLA
jgi:hypothetical protein